MTPEDAIDWLEDHQGCALISDDNGHWAVACDGIQNVATDDGPFDVETTFFVVKDRWYPTILEAVEATKKEGEE